MLAGWSVLWGEAAFEVSGFIEFECPPVGEGEVVGEEGCEKGVDEEGEGYGCCGHHGV